MSENAVSSSNDWIPVGQELPSEDSRVLVYMANRSDDGTPTDWWWQMTLTLYRDGFHVHNPSAITHWMYAPGSPC